MRLLADTPGFADQLERITAARRAYRARRIAELGFPETVACPTCGDAGIVPDDPARRCCPACDTGRALIALAERERAWAAKVPRRVAAFRLETAPDRAAADLVRAWLDRAPWETGRNLVLTGPPGTGKTGLAYGALHVAHLAGIGVHAVGIADWIATMRPAADDAQRHAQDVAARLSRRAPLLLLDDLGVERNSEFTRERIHALLDGRYNDRRPTIVTSNLTTAEMRPLYGDRIVDRLLEHADGRLMAGPNLRLRTRDA